MRVPIHNLRPKCSVSRRDACLYGIATFASIAFALTGCSQQESRDSTTSENLPSDSNSSTQHAANSVDVTFDSIPPDKLISVEELSEMLKQESHPLVVDIRSKGDYLVSFIAGSKNIPAGRQFSIRMNEIPTDCDIVLIALDESGLAECRNALLEAGFDDQRIFVVKGGMNAWTAAGYPTEAKAERKC